MGCFLLWGCDGEGSSSSKDKPEDISASDAQDAESATIPDIVDDLGNVADTNPLDSFGAEDKDEPIGGFSNDSVPSKTATTSSSDEEKSNPGRDDDCVIQ